MYYNDGSFTICDSINKDNFVILLNPINIGTLSFSSCDINK